MRHITYTLNNAVVHSIIQSNFLGSNLFQVKENQLISKVVIAGSATWIRTRNQRLNRALLYR